MILRLFLSLESIRILHKNVYKLPMEYIKKYEFFILVVKYFPNE